MSRLSDNYPPGGDAESQWRALNKGKIATGEFLFIGLVELLYMLGCISKDTFTEANFDEDYMSENYN